MGNGKPRSRIRWPVMDNVKAKTQDKILSCPRKPSKPRFRIRWPQMDNIKAKIHHKILLCPRKP